jgi:hypothetical protein
MNASPLVTYLNDHLSGSVAAVELLARLEEEHAGTGLDEFLRGLRAEVEEEQGIVRGLLAAAGGGESAVKKAAAWVAEKASRAKLGLAARDGGPDLQLFEALETLSLAVLGKRALWRALSAGGAAPGRAVDFEALAERSERQWQQLESRRIEVARRILRPS